MKVPINVPKVPIEIPVTKKIFIIFRLDAPIAPNTAMSANLLFTSIIIDEIILNAATIIISVKIINITFLSTLSAFIKEAFLSTQSVINSSFSDKDTILSLI